MLTLINSGLSSPFGRKIRIVLYEMGLTYRDDVRPGLRSVEELRPLNPNLNLPVLIDGSQVLFDSNVIIDYLLERYATPPQKRDMPPLAPSMTRHECRWQDLRLLATIETFANTLVNVRHFRSEGQTADVSKYMRRQESRLESCLDWLEDQATDEGFWPGCFSVMDIALVCPLSYAEGRNVLAWRGRPKLECIFDRARLRQSFIVTCEQSQQAVASRV